MRISVCEFLRVATREKWYYTKPGQWVNSDASMTSVREGDSTFRVYRGRRVVKTLHYFEGKTSYQVRMEAKGRGRRK